MDTKEEILATVATAQAWNPFTNCVMYLHSTTTTTVARRMPSSPTIIEHGNKRYELSNHLGNVLAVITDKLLPNTTYDPNLLDDRSGTQNHLFLADVVSATDYYAFGMVMPGRTFEVAGAYRYGFNGKEKEDGINIDNYDFGARIYDGRVARFLSIDPMSAMYPGMSHYSYAMNTPIQAIDQDGNAVIFITGLRLMAGGTDQRRWSSMYGIFDPLNVPAKLRDYWRAEPNTFGRNVDMVMPFLNRMNDYHVYYTSGSSAWTSQVTRRYDEGIAKANLFDDMVCNGSIVLCNDETIKIVSHSQGGAHAAGMASRLIELGYKVEVIYYITPHQPTDIEHPMGPRGVQYSHPGDAISSDSPWWLPNGGTELGPIQGIDEYDDRRIMGDQGQPDCEGPRGNRCGHNAPDNDFIFDIKQGENGYIEPRKDDIWKE
jgi:RHS repeat-associated protein